MGSIFAYTLSTGFYLHPRHVARIRTTSSHKVDRTKCIYSAFVPTPALHATFFVNARLHVHGVKLFLACPRQPQERQIPFPQAQTRSTPIQHSLCPERNICGRQSHSVNLTTLSHIVVRMTCFLHHPVCFATLKKQIRIGFQGAVATSTRKAPVILFLILVSRR